MANFIAFLTIIFFAFTTANSQSNITRGSSLRPTGANTSWLSPSGLFAFGFYPQTHGYAVGVYIAGIPEKTVVWTATRDTLPFLDNATLRFTSDGRLTVEQTLGQQINLFDTDVASIASMQDSGNFVLYDSTGTRVWESFEHPTETLLAGQRLLPGQTLFSSVSLTDQSIGVFRLIMQDDGNLVKYPYHGLGDRAYWATDTPTAGPNVTLNLDSSGFLYLLQNSTFFIHNLTQGGYPTKDSLYLARFDVDGIFRLYRHNLSNTNRNGSVIWASMSNECDVWGLCGINAYCMLMDDAARCRCLPGFELVNPERWSLGCQRNSTIESCKMQDADTTIHMTTLNNVQWNEAAYSEPLKAKTQEQCSSACLNDCNCEAALFTGQECKLQRLPLRFVRVSNSESNVGLIKVYTSSPTNGSYPTNEWVDVKKVRQKETIIIGVSLISFGALVLLISGVVIYRTRVWAYRKISENQSVQLFEDIGPRAFSYAALEKITDGFKEELGRGTFGIVYKGIIEGSMRPVAVKKLKQELAQEGEREFQTEMKVIGRTHHRNLTKLLGYCCEGPERLLVFEYMTKGSLADILFGSKESKPKPCWMERFRMAVDIAHGILYLHEECEKPIIHCDIKPQNILMDEYGCAKISDFGLAKLLEHDQTKTSTLIRGTRGYVAPEWHKRLPITVKVDVYSFGIVLFNILCCRVMKKASRMKEKQLCCRVMKKGSQVMFLKTTILPGDE